MSKNPDSPETLLLCAIAKDEDQYIEEWVDFHIRLGVDKIVIYDNDSKNPISLASCEGAPRDVKVIPWKTKPGIAPQTPAYNDCLSKFSSCFDWMLFLDIDEFLNLKADTSITEFLARFAQADGVAINWRMFGSSNRAHNDGKGVLRRFSLASVPEFPPNAHVKTMFRPSAVVGAGVHVPTFHPAARLVNPSNIEIEAGSLQWNIDLSIAQINHYFVKSQEEFTKKRKRGRADVEMGNELKYRLEGEFSMYDVNDVEELSILRHLRQGEA